ncbi:hypothetical protein Tco_0643474, partial [Tanacetum coccineum]
MALIPIVAVHQQQYQAPVLQQSYQAPAIQQSSSPELDSGLVPYFNPSNDPIANLNKLMGFEPSNNLRWKSYCLDSTVQGRQTQGYANNKARNTATNPGVNRQGAPVQARVVNHSTQASQEIPTPAAFQTDDLDAFDFDCDDVPSAKAVLMDNLSSYDSDVLLEVIVERNAKVADFEKQIHSLKLQLNATVESHKILSKTVECLKKKSKQKEDKYFDEVIDLQKKSKALDNVVYKMGQSTQTMHMLTKPQAFYNETHKTAHGYQKTFYLSQARRKVFALYDGNTIVKTHVALSVTNSEETLELAKESRLKMLAKQNNPSLKEKRVNIALVDYVALNKLSEHFVKHFVPRKQLSTGQAYW